MSDYRLVEANAAGRDFVVGDIHGMFGRVEEALSKVNFDPSRDRLFCVGDLIDRGPRSGEVVRFLDQPFVHAVCGNHEDALLQVHAGSSRPNSETWLDGADWWHELSQDERRTVISRLERLPLVIEVPTPRGNVAFLHGDVPRGMHWSDFRVALKTEPEKIRNTALWGRSRIGRGDDSGVPGIGRVFVGHTPQWGGLRRYGNVYAIDTGAVFGWMGRDGHLTCVNIQSPTEGLVEVRQVGTLGVDALDQPAPDRPFGSYARPMPNTPQGRSKAIEGTVETRASRSRMNQETGRVDSRHVEKMPVEVLERLLTTPFRKKYVYFREYTERRPKHAWNHKPIVGPPDRPFAELQYVQRLENEGWIAGWCYRPGEFISSWEPEKRPVLFPTEAQELLARIARRAGEKAGCWDVFAWKDGSPLFVELKRRRSRDRLRDGQKRWRDAASQLGVPASAFLEVEWLGGCLDGYSLKAMSLFQARIDSWVRYRRGKYEFGGPDPSEAKDWLELYRQRTGLEGADLLWVLFRDNAGGTTTYWSIEQSRDRTR